MCLGFPSRRDRFDSGVPLRVSSSVLMDESVISGIKKMRRAGVPILRIAEELGVSPYLVQKHSRPRKPLKFSCLKCGHPGHKSSYCKTDPSLYVPIARKHVPRAAPIQCTSCDQPGHKKNQCPNPVFAGSSNPAAAAYARRHREAGLCTSCPRKAAPGYGECEKCRERALRRSQR